MADDGKDEEFPDDPNYQRGDGLDAGDKDSEEPDPLPVPEMPEIPEDEKPTEEEIGNWDEADAEEGGEGEGGEGEGATTRQFTSNSINLPGAKGPLEVDSVGDYLEDFDFSGLDQIARQNAMQGYEMLQAAQEEEQKEKDRIQGIRQWHADNRSKRKLDLPRDPQRPNRPPDWLIAGEDPPEEALPAGEEPPAPRAGNPEKIDPVKQGEGMFRVPPDENLPEPLVRFSNQPRDEQGLEDQQRLQLDIPPESSQSDQGLRGQNESATEQAIEQATDAIKTNNARILDLIEDMAQVLKGHETQINQIRDMLDMEGRGDEY